jgi:hypothetical protein
MTTTIHHREKIYKYLAFGPEYWRKPCSICLAYGPEYRGNPCPICNEVTVDGSPRQAPWTLVDKHLSHVFCVREPELKIIYDAAKEQKRISEKLEFETWAMGFLQLEVEQQEKIKRNLIGGQNEL